MTAEEIGRFSDALDSYVDQNAANAPRLLLLTGAREGEVLKAEWNQFNLGRGTWTKPSHHTKQKKIEHVPLSRPAIDLLTQMNSKSSTGPLFPGPNGDSRVALRRPWVQVCKAAGLAELVQVKGKKRIITRYKPTLRIHDLRHTYASHLVSVGTSLHIVGKLLGHTQPQTTARYAHVADEACWLSCKITVRKMGAGQFSRPLVRHKPNWLGLDCGASAFLDRCLVNCKNQLHGVRQRS